MGLPSKKRTKTSQRQRRSHFAVKATDTRECPKCQAPVLPHKACKACGTYRGKTVKKTK